MRNSIRAILAAMSLLLPFMALAQGTLQVSNLDQTSTGSLAVGSDSWIAQGFYMVADDPNTYALDGVQLLLNSATGSPNDFTVSIYSAVNGIPQNHLGDLVGPDDPSDGNIYSYSASGITVWSADYYYVVVGAATLVAHGSYNWSAADKFTRNGSWTIDNVYLSSADGSNWAAHGREKVFQMALYATVVPEPTASVLVGLGLAGLAFWRWRR